MKTTPEDFFSDKTPDEIYAENEVLKLKLEMEFGVNYHYSDLPPEAENYWLKQVYGFERRFRDRRKFTVYEALGKPEVKRIETLATVEVDHAVDQILGLMEKKGIVLDRCTGYENALIYKFITEELFQKEVEDGVGEDFIQHFIYEDFHPNHEHDLRRYTDEFFELLFRRELKESDSHHFSATVSLKGIIVEALRALSVIKMFKKANGPFTSLSMGARGVDFNLELCRAEVQTIIRYQNANGEQFEGTAVISFTHEVGFWYINGVQVPGF